MFVSSAGTLYCPLAHLPRSTSRHRSLQNGRFGFSSHVMVCLQIGHFITTLLSRSRKTPTVDSDQPADQIIVEGLSDFNAAEVTGGWSNSFDIIDEHNTIDAWSLRFKAALP